MSGLTLSAVETALAVEQALLALVDPVHDSRLWDEHLTRVERLETLRSHLANDGCSYPRSAL